MEDADPDQIQGRSGVEWGSWPNILDKILAKSGFLEDMPKDRALSG